MLYNQRSSRSWPDLRRQSLSSAADFGFCASADWPGVQVQAQRCASSSVSRERKSVVRPRWKSPHRYTTTASARVACSTSTPSDAHWAHAGGDTSRDTRGMINSVDALDIRAERYGLSVGHSGSSGTAVERRTSDSPRRERAALERDVLEQVLHVAMHVVLDARLPHQPL